MRPSRISYTRFRSGLYFKHNIFDSRYHTRTQRQYSVSSSCYRRLLHINGFASLGLVFARHRWLDFCAGSLNSLVDDMLADNQAYLDILLAWATPERSL